MTVSEGRFDKVEMTNAQGRTIKVFSKKSQVRARKADCKINSKIVHLQGQPCISCEIKIH